MSFKIFDVRIKISFLLISMLTFFSLCDKSGLFIIAFLTALIHELGHIITAGILRLSIKSISFLPCGIKMNLNKPLSLVKRSKKLILFASGSTVNVLCFILIFLFSKEINVAALVHLVTAIFNLLPVGTLDGGRILKELLITENIEKGERICDFISLILAAVLFVFGAITLFKTKYNLSLIITSLYLALTVIIKQ